MHAWRTWCSFSERERIQWLLLPLVTAGLRLFGLRRVQTYLDHLSVQTPGRMDLQAAQAVARILYSAVHRSLMPARCLERSLVLHWLLRRVGLAADLRIGVAKPEGSFAAHAWVEHGGVALEENEMNREYVVIEKAFAPSQGREA